MSTSLSVRMAGRSRPAPSHPYRPRPGAAGHRGRLPSAAAWEACGSLSGICPRSCPRRRAFWRRPSSRGGPCSTTWCRHCAPRLPASAVRWHWPSSCRCCSISVSPCVGRCFRLHHQPDAAAGRHRAADRAVVRLRPDAEDPGLVALVASFRCWWRLPGLSIDRRRAAAAQPVASSGRRAGSSSLAPAVRLALLLRRAAYIHFHAVVGAIREHAGAAKGLASTC